MIVVGDDLCTATGAFISVDLYEEVSKPFYQRQIDAIRREGVQDLCSAFPADVRRRLPCSLLKSNRPVDLSILSMAQLLILLNQSKNDLFHHPLA